MLSILDAGFLLSVLLLKYLDFALFVALFGPLSTLVFIWLLLKLNKLGPKQ